MSESQAERREALEPAAALEQERGFLERFQGKGRRAAEALMVLSALTFGQGCDRYENYLKKHEIEIGAKIQPVEGSEERLAFLKELDAIQDPVSSTGTPFISEEYLTLWLLKRHPELRQGPAGEGFTDGWIDSTMALYREPPRAGDLSWFDRMKPHEMKIMQGGDLLDQDPQKLFNEVEALERDAYLYFNELYPDPDGQPGQLGASGWYRARDELFDGSFSGLRFLNYCYWHRVKEQR